MTAAMAADALGYATTHAGRYDDASWFFSLATAILDRLHAQDSLAAAWILNDKRGWPTCGAIWRMARCMPVAPWR